MMLKRPKCQENFSENPVAQVYHYQLEINVGLKTYFSKEEFNLNERLSSAIACS